MKVTAVRKKPADGDVVAVPVHAGRAVPKAARAGLPSVDFLASRGFEGKPGEVLALPGEGGTTVLAVGLGPADGLTADVLRRAAATSVRSAGGAKHLVLDLLAGVPASLDKAVASQALAEGAVLGAYAYTAHKSSAPPSRPAETSIVGADKHAVAKGIRVAEAVKLARDLTNEPPGTMTPRDLAQVAADIAAKDPTLTATIWDEGTIEDEKLGGLRGVSLGSDQPPRLIRLVYEPPAAKGKDGKDGKDGKETDGRAPHVALVGKGITFDSGGLSIKTADGMKTMKSDMAGAAAVIATMSVLADAGVRVKVTAIVPATENLPGPEAIKPGDVLRFRNGKTAEILNTDAEGRLVLADGLSLAVEAEPDAIVDLATLTGAVRIALGSEIAGLMSTSDGLCEQLSAASERAGEAMWRLPLAERYRRQLDSDVADMKNIGTAGGAGSIIAGLFLKEFVAGVPWAHLDIASTSWTDADDHLTTKGATGFGVRTLVELLSAFEPIS